MMTEAGNLLHQVKRAGEMENVRTVFSTETADVDRRKDDRARDGNSNFTEMTGEEEQDGLISQAPRRGHR